MRVNFALVGRGGGYVHGERRAVLEHAPDPLVAVLGIVYGRGAAAAVGNTIQLIHVSVVEIGVIRPEGIMAAPNDAGRNGVFVNQAVFLRIQVKLVNLALREIGGILHIVGGIVDHGNGLIDGRPEILIVLGAFGSNAAIPGIMAGFFDAAVAEQEIAVVYAQRNIVNRVIPGDVNVIPVVIDIDQIPDVVHLFAGCRIPGDAELIEHSAVCHGIGLTYACFVFEESIGGIDGIREIVFIVGAEIIVGAQKLAFNGAGLPGICNDFIDRCIKSGNAGSQIAAGIQVYRQN